MTGKPAAADMLAALHRYYRNRHGERYALVTELSASMHDVAPGFGGSRTLRRIDALVVAGGTLTAVEIKVDRGDFLRETDEKRAPWRALTHRFLYLAPAGIIRKEEVPAGCGLLELPRLPEEYGGGCASYALQTVRPRLNKDPAPMPFAVVQRLLYKAAADRPGVC